MPHSDAKNTSAPRSGKPVSRRNVLSGLGAIGLSAMGAAACSNVSAPGASTTTGGAGKKLELTMFVFLGGDLGVMPKAFAKEWEASHPNVKLTIYEESNSVGYPKMVARKTTNPNSPLVHFGFFNAQTTEQGILDKMFTKLDYSAIKNAADIRDVFKRQDQYGIGIGADQIGLLYNTAKLGSSPQSWAELWDPKNQGKVSFFNFPWYAVYMAAKTRGGGLDNMDPGFALWAERAKNIRTIVTANPEYQNVLASGTAPLTAYFNGTGHQFIKAGAPLTYAPSTEGPIPVPVNLCVVDGISDDEKTAATEVIDAMLDPKWNAQWAATSIEVPANQKATLPPDLASLPALSESTIAKLQTIDYALVGKNTSAWSDRWKREVQARM